MTKLFFDNAFQRSCSTNVNIAKKHVKANPNAGETGGIIDKAMPLNISNVAIFNAATGNQRKDGDDRPAAH